MWVDIPTNIGYNRPTHIIREKGKVMKETEISYAVRLDLIHPTTGEVTPVTADMKESNKYYSIKKLTTRINSMNLFELMSKTRKSGKEIALFGTLMEMANDENKIVITNMTKFSKDVGIDRSDLYKFIKRLESVRPERLLYKPNTGIYIINPYLLIGKRVRSNAYREQLQEEWDTLMDEYGTVVDT